MRMDTAILPYIIGTFVHGVYECLEHREGRAASLWDIMVVTGMLIIQICPFHLKGTTLLILRATPGIRDLC